MTKADREGQRKAPILRFKGFTDDWEQRKLGDIFSKIRNAFVGKVTDYYVDRGFIYLESNNIKNGGINLNTKKYINNEFYYQQKEKWLHTNDIVMVQSGDVGQTAVIPSNLNNTAAHALIMFQEIDSNINPYFLNYQFQSYRCIKQIQIISKGNTVKHVLASDMKEFTVFLASLKEQINVADFLNKLNRIIDLYEMKKQLLTQLKQGIVNFLITKNGQKPQLRFIGFNNNWESKSFEKLLNYEQPTKYIVKKADYISQGTPVLTANKSFILGYTNETNVYQSIPAIIFDDFTLESKYVDFPFMVKSSAIKILTSKNSNLFFIYQLLNNQKFVQEGHSRHYISVVQKKKVLVPSIQEQNKIGNLIKQLENSIEQNSNTITLLKRLKEFLLQNMFL